MGLDRKRFNDILSLVVIVLGLYIVLLPFLPQVSYWFRDKSPNSIAPYAGALAESVGSDSTKTPDGNRIVIPDIALDEPILGGNSIGVISGGGTWHRPKSKSPLENGNTVIVGHRFFGSNASTFYNLDKLQPGQKIAVYWDGREVLYEVVETKVVDPSATEIEEPTDYKRLTLYTCTPIWTAKNRLVIIAKPIEINEVLRRDKIER